MEMSKRNRDILKVRKAGLSLKAIAACYGLSITRVQQIIDTPDRSDRMISTRARNTIVNAICMMGDIDKISDRELLDLFSAHVGDPASYRAWRLLMQTENCGLKTATEIYAAMGIPKPVYLGSPEHLEDVYGPTPDDDLDPVGWAKALLTPEQIAEAEARAPGVFAMLAKTGLTLTFRKINGRYIFSSMKLKEP